MKKFIYPKSCILIGEMWSNVFFFFTYEANISTKKAVFISKILFKKHHADNETSFVRITSIDHCAKTEQER